MPNAEIVKIRSEFSEYKKTTDQRLDEIIDKLKPQFTKPQITTFLFSLIGIMTSIFLYVGSMKTDIELLKEHAKDESLHMPLDKKIKTFVLKDNYDSNIKEIKTDIKEIKTDIKSILKNK